MHHSPAPQGRPSVRYKPWMLLRGGGVPVKICHFDVQMGHILHDEYTKPSFVSITEWWVPHWGTVSGGKVRAWWTVSTSRPATEAEKAELNWWKSLPKKLICELLLACQSLDWPISLVYRQSGSEERLPILNPNRQGIDKLFGQEVSLI